MRVRDGHARINGSDTIYEMPSGGLEILTDDGQTLFSIDIKDNVLRIDSGSVCKHNGKMLDDLFQIRPKAANCIELIKVEYVRGTGK